MGIAAMLTTSLVLWRSAILIFTVGILIGYLFHDLVNSMIHKQTTFTNKINGYSYDYVSLGFISPEDRNIAISKLVKLLAKNNLNYSSAQLSKLKDGFIIGMLESNDETDTSLQSYKDKLIILTSTEYSMVMKLFNKKTQVFSDSNAKQIGYGLLSDYYSKQNIDFPKIDDLSDKQIYFRLTELSSY
jgi:hypothetical protein